MKKILTSGIVFSALIGVGSALAAVENDQSTSSLTTKGYVDAGLIYVNNRVNGAVSTANSASSTAAANAAAIESLQETVGGHTTSINSLTTTTGNHTTAIETLQNQVQALSQGDTDSYSGGEGIDVENHEISITGLAATQEVANQGKKYIYQNGTLQPLEIEDSWDAGIFD